MKKRTPLKKEVVIYQGKSGAIELKGDFSHETVWATQAQIAKAFDVTPQNVTMHIRNIYKDKELSQKATCKKSLQVQKEGSRTITRELQEYNLDIIIAVGYRISSVVGTKFRQWATKTLRSHIIDGYTINRSRIAKNYESWQKAITHLEKLAPHTSIDTKSVLDLIKLFGSTWVSLDAYDSATLPKKGATKKQVRLAADELIQAISELKQQLIKQREATNLFASEKNTDSLQGIVGNIMQSFGGKDLYGSVEEKAAHLLYFIVKDHPFNDGNKRSGAFAFVWYLQKAGKLNEHRLTPEALTALTLLVAESDPKDKEHIIGLILLLLK
jgi:prophage maintenance system killer protein